MAAATHGETAVLVHGFTGAPASWRAVAAALERPVVPALPGHAGGLSVDLEAGFDGGIDWLLEILSSLSNPLHLVGYSLGARLCLGALTRGAPNVARATLIGVGFGLEGDRARRDRVTWEQHVLTLLREQGLEAFLSYWEALPLFATQTSLPEASRQPQAKIRRLHDAGQLADAFEAFALSQMPNYWGSLPELQTDVQLIAGALDTKYVAQAKRAASLSGRCVAVSVPGVGHNVLLEAPAALVELLRPKSSRGGGAA